MNQVSAPRRDKPSMLDVAKRAGVSPQTVSRVSNGEQYVSEEKRERVFQAMRELGYRPNSAARAMRRGLFKTIGLVFHSLHSVGNQRTVEAISEAAAQKGYTITLLPLEAATQRAADGAFTKVGEMAVDAVIAIVPSRLTEDADMHLPIGVPAVVLGPPLLEGASSLDFDNSTGTRAAVELLLELGHETVHHIAGPADSYASMSREEVWRETLAVNGRMIPTVFRGDWSPDSGYQAAQRLLNSGASGGEVPSAIFVSNDQMALGVTRALLEHGLRIPQDVSIIGFDNIDEAVAFPTPLTTISQDWRALGEIALDLALQMIDGLPATSRVFPTELVVRDSAATPAGVQPRQP